MIPQIIATVMFDPTISLGTIAQILTLLVVAGKVVSKMSAMETKVNAMWADFVQMKVDE